MKTFDAILDWLKERKNLVFLSLIFLLLAFPAISTNEYILGIVIFANIGAVYAASWDLTAGVAGQFSFGQILFFGIAGYVSAALNSYLGLPALLTIPIGGAFGALVGMIICLPSLRLRGPYFMIVSLVFPSILGAIIGLYPEISGGESGFYGLSPVGNTVTEYYASVFLMLASIFVLLLILSSRIGLVFRSIREDPDVAEATGINTTKYKLLAWGIGGFFAGIAGGFNTHIFQTINPSVFLALGSFQAIIFTFLGGFGTIVGPVMGSYILTILDELLRFITDLRALLYATVMLLVAMYLPFGIYRLLAIRFDIQIGTWNGLKEIRRKRSIAPNP